MTGFWIETLELAQRKIEFSNIELGEWFFQFNILWGHSKCTLQNIIYYQYLMLSLESVAFLAFSTQISELYDFNVQIH